MTVSPSKFIPNLYENGTWRALTQQETKKLQFSINYTQNSIANQTIVLHKLQISINPQKPVSISALKFSLQLPKQLACVHMPHLSPLETMTTGEKEFRSPAVIFEDDKKAVALIPNIDEMKLAHEMPYIMDYDQESGCVYYGIGNHTETGHVYYTLTDEKTILEQSIEFSFYIAVTSKKKAQRKRDFRWVTSVLWELFGKNELLEDEKALHPEGLKCYVDYVYDWAFNRWQDICWQEFDLNSKRVGGVVFIVTAKQKPGLGKEDVWREPKSLWNQAWFSSLRSAYGYYLWGKRTDNQDWIDRAKKALRFALAAPQVNGLFPGYFIADENNDLSKGHWVNSPPRRPKGHEDYVHLLDSSWTCYWLLKWYQDIELSDEILAYVAEYARTLLTLQNKDGSFPAWIVPQTMQVSPFLQKSPEAAIHIMLFCSLFKLTQDTVYLESCKKTAEFLMREIVPTGRWEDFETYWSCSQEWEGKKYGEKDKRSGLYNTCNFSMYWCAEGFLALYELTRERRYLEYGEQVLAELSLYQQLNRPATFPVETIGGFAVLNSDNEWNDARQSLFALTYLNYYKATSSKEYLLRGLYAMKASFYMMYCPENPETKSCYELAHPHFNENEYGFHMENFNHKDKRSKNGIGEFTIFDWGNGAACSSLIEFLKIYEKIEEKPN